MQSTMGSNQSIRKSIESKGYQIISTIGKGSFGIVYKVRKYYYFGFLYKLSKYNFDDQCYAIKCETRMYMDEDKRMREVLIGKKLNHPNIVHIIDHFFGVNEMLYQIMEICECNLSKWFTDYPKNREYNRCIEMFNGITNGLKYIHEKNIIHRNLNPNNVLIKNGMCKVADFGLSVETNDERSHSSGVGNIIYAAPEVFGRHYDFKVDIYSLGCIFCEFFTEFNSNELRKSALANITVRIPENFFIKISDYNTRAKKLLKKMIDDNPINRPSMDFITSECSFIRNRLKNLPSSGFSRSLYRFYRLLIDDPLPYITVHPLEDNVLEWYIKLIF
jgi:serine/threonine protein kinase